MSEALSVAARAIVEEEEALLLRVRRALARGAPARPRSQAAARELVSLRDQAVGASERDLPALLQGLTIAQALAGREQVQVVPSKDAPYFAHLRLQHPDGPRDYLLGRATWVDLEAQVRIVDWRLSPIAAVFYQHEEGAEVEEELPGGRLTARVLARRILVIERGRLTGVIAGRRSLARHAAGWVEDGAGAFQGGGAGRAARPGLLGTGAGARGARGRPEVTALLDPEQYAAVSADPRRHLLVTGSAGSGKTTVALHRLARIAARPDAGGVAVVVPEEGLARLSRRLLEPLGLPGVRVETLDAWLRRSAAALFGPRAVKLSPETPALVQSLKRHPALAEPLLGRIGPQKARSLRPLRTRLAEAFTDRAFLAGVVEAAGGSLPVTAVEETVRHTLRQIATPLSRQLRGVDPERLQALDGRPLEEGTPDELAGTLDVEDLALCLWLRARGGARPGDGLSHLVVDEAEDVSVFELFLLGRLLAREGSLTLAGDEAQRTLQGAGGWDAALEAAGARDAAACRLSVSYRCPAPVAALAHRVLGDELGPAEAPRSARAGAEVGFHHFPDGPQAHLFLAAALRDLLEREPAASVGVVAADAGAARGFHASLQALPEARLVLDGRFGFAPGVDVTDVAGAKGLEFDYVVVPDATAAAYPASDEARRRLHVAVTRAAHQLWLLSAGRRSPILAEAAAPGGGEAAVAPAGLSSVTDR